jgi:hypothetical protein
VYRRGLGATQSDIATCAPTGGFAHDAWAAIDPTCFAYSPSAWSQMAGFSPSALATMPVAPSAVSAGASTVPAPYTQAEYDAAVNAALAQGLTETQANNLAASQSQSSVCGSGESLAADGSCVASTNWLLWGGVALVGLFAIVALGGGSPRRYGR